MHNWSEQAKTWLREKGDNLRFRINFIAAKSGCQVELSAYDVLAHAFTDVSQRCQKIDAPSVIKSRK